MVEFILGTLFGIHLCIPKCIFLAKKSGHQRLARALDRMTNGK